MPKSDHILEAFREIGARLKAEGLEGRILLAGGASMCLVHSARESTEDVDALYEPQNPITLHSFEVGEKYGWEPGWLNQGIKAFMDEDAPSELFVSFPGLQVFTVVPEYLLAMKLKAGRPESSDFDDAALLLAKLGLKSAEEAISVFAKFFNDDASINRALLVLESIFENR